MFVGSDSPRPTLYCVNAGGAAVDRRRLVTPEVFDVAPSWVYFPHCVLLKEPSPAPPLTLTPRSRMFECKQAGLVPPVKPPSQCRTDLVVGARTSSSP